MTNTIQDYANGAQLSDVAYIEFRNPDNKAMNIQDLTDAGFTATQADDFLSKYMAVDQLSHDIFGFSSGLSVTLFSYEENGITKYTVAIAGTNDAIDFLMDGYVAANEPAGLYTTIKYLSDQVNEWYNNGDIQGQIDIVCHSLGGLLAVGITDLQPNDRINNVYTYNSPNVDFNDLLYSATRLIDYKTTGNISLDGLPSSNKFTHLRGEGASPIANLHSEYPSWF